MRACARSTSSTSTGGTPPHTSADATRHRAEMERNNRTIMASFDDLGLSPKALAAVASLGYEEPTPVPRTARFRLSSKDTTSLPPRRREQAKPPLSRFPRWTVSDTRRVSSGPLMLVVTPTRELAAADCRGLRRPSAKSTHHRVLSVVGGVSYNPQISALRRGTDVLIATPGPPDRPHGAAAPSHLTDVEVLVLDEADRMLDMGFLSVGEKDRGRHAERRARRFCSPPPSTAPSRRALGHAACATRRIVEIAHKGETADTVDQCIVHVPPDAQGRPSACAMLNGKGTSASSCSPARAAAPTRRAADLKRAGFRRRGHPLRPHARTSAAARSRTSRRGTTDILVATDVLARGIDVRRGELRRQLRPARHSRRTTCTASGARGAPARRAARFPSSHPRRRKRSRDIEKFIEAQDSRGAHRGL